MHEQLELPLPTTHFIESLDQTGHTTTEWDPNDPASVERARTTFNDLLSKGYTAYRMNAAGEQGEKVKTFDPTHGRYLMHPRMAGG